MAHKRGLISYACYIEGVIMALLHMSSHIGTQIEKQPLWGTCLSLKQSKRAIELGNSWCSKSFCSKHGGCRIYWHSIGQETCHVTKPRVHEAGNSFLPIGNTGTSYENGWEWIIFLQVRGLVINCKQLYDLQQMDFKVILCLDTIFLFFPSGSNFVV